MSTIVIDFLNVFCSTLNTIFAGLIQFIFHGFLDGSLSPSITKMDELLNGNVSTIINFFSWASGVLIVVFCVFHAVSTFLFRAMGTDMKTTLQSMFLRLAFCFIALAMVVNFGNWALDTGMTFYSKALEYFGSQTTDGNYGFGELGDTNTGIGEAINTLKEDLENGDEIKGKENPVVFGIETGAVLVGTSFAPITITIVAIIRVIVLILCGYNLIKLIAELASRYVMTMTLYMGLPMCLPFYTSIETEQVFFTYLRMFGTEIGILILTQIWISISFYVYETLTSALVTVFLFIAWTRIGVRLEQFLKDMGLSTTSMGASLFNEVALSAGIMAMGISRLGGLAGNMALNAGAYTGNMKLGRVGSAILGKGVGVESVASAMANSAGGVMRAEKEFANMNPLAKAMMNGTDARILPSILASVGKDSRKEMTDGVLDTIYGNVKDAEALKGFKISTVGTIGKNGLGVVLNDGTQTLQGVISDRKAGKGFTSIPFTDVSGNQMYLNVPANGKVNFTASELAQGTPDGQAHYENMTTGYKYQRDADGNIMTDDSGNKILMTDENGNAMKESLVENGEYRVNADGSASIYDGNRLYGIVTPKGEELYASPTDFGSNNRIFEELNQNTGKYEPVSFNDMIGTDKTSATPVKIASMFSSGGEDMFYNGHFYRTSGGGVPEFSNICDAKDINIDSMKYDKSTGSFSFNTISGKHFDFVDACHGYATHSSGKIVGSKQTGQYYVKESPMKVKRENN